jgi:hypothetical protein
METEHQTAGTSPSPERHLSGTQTTIADSTTTNSEPPPSYVKLAMRNMVRKRGKSLQHFFLTTAALLGLFVGLSYLTR